MQLTASYEDFLKLDIRVGRIERVKPFPKAKKPAYRLWVNFGPLGVRQSSAQITRYYTPEDLVGRQVLAVVNLPPKTIAGFKSEVLVLGVDGTQDEQGGGGVVLLMPEREVSLGARMY